MLKLLGLFGLGLLTLYGLEFAGIVPKGEYLPFVPRWEQPLADANEPLELKWRASDMSETEAYADGQSQKLTDRVSDRNETLLNR